MREIGQSWEKISGDYGLTDRFTRVQWREGLTSVSEGE